MTQGAVDLRETQQNGVTWLTIRCEPCKRYGRLKVANLVAQYGADMGLPDLRARLAGDCPPRANADIHDQCEARITYGR
jgi:hypothetical protein